MTTDNYPSWDAKAFDEPEFQGLFREIHFAIIEDHNSHGRNYNSFKDPINLDNSQMNGVVTTFQK